MAFFLLFPIVLVGICLFWVFNQERLSEEANKEIELYEKKLKAEIAEHEKEVGKWAEKWGKCTLEIPIITKRYELDLSQDLTLDDIYASSRTYYISVFEESSIVIIDSKEYPFSDILGFSLVDDATSETITTSIGGAKTSTGSMLGRAVVGGMLIGGLGAVAGAATAKKDIETNATSLTTTTHKYTMYINVNSIKNPTIPIPIGEDEQTAHQLAGLFNVIIAKGQKIIKNLQ